MKKKGLFKFGGMLLILLLAALPFLGSCAAPAPPAGKVIVWDAFYWGSPGSPWLDVISNKWAEAVDAKIKPNTFILNWHYGPTLAKGTETIDGIKAGTFEYTLWYPTYVPEKAPLATLPMGGFGILESAEKSVRVMNEYYTSPMIKAEFEPWDALPLFSNALSPQEFIFKPAVKTVADMKGLKMRGPGRNFDILSEKLGMTPVSLSSTETYGGLERGVIDGAGMGYPVSMYKFGLHPIAKYVYRFGVGYSGGVFIAKLSAFNALPREVQEAMLEEATNVPKWLGEIYAEQDAEALAAFKKASVTTTQASGEDLRVIQQAMRAIEEQAIQEMEKKGLPAKKAYDFLEELKKKYR